MSDWRPTGRKWKSGKGVFKEIRAANFTESVNILIYRSRSKASQAGYIKGTHM